MMRYDDDSFTVLDTRDGRRVTLRMMQKAVTPADWLRLFPNPAESARSGSYNKFLKIFMGKADDCRDEADEDDDDRDEIDREDEGNGDRGDDGGGGSDHALSRLADLTVESGKFSSRAEALNWLISHPNGHAFTRLHKVAATAKESPMTSLQDIAKTHGVDGVVQIAKNIVEEQRSFRITEEEFVNLCDTAARVAHPALGARALERVYEHNPVLAKAIAVIKAGLAEQMLSGGMPVQVVRGADARDVDNPQAALDAYARLQEIGKQRWPGASEAAQFANAFEAHPELAAKAHRRPTAPAGGAYPFPR
jgi:hypothetical protein